MSVAEPYPTSSRVEALRERLVGMRTADLDHSDIGIFAAARGWAIGRGNRRFDAFRGGNIAAAWLAKLGRFFEGGQCRSPAGAPSALWQPSFVFAAGG
jgi:hypothetical protein